MTIASIVGCDATGKSTIVENLCKQFNCTSTHFSNPKDMADGKKQYFDFLVNANDHNKMYICDRFYDGEWIYAPIYRGYIGNYLREIEREIIKNHNHLIQYVTADLQTIVQRARTRGEDFVKEEHFQTILNNYKNNFLMEQRMPFSIIDTTHITKDEGTQKALNNIEKLNKIWDEVRKCYNSQLTCKNSVKPVVFPWGNINAKYLIVGQNPGGRGKEDKNCSTVFSTGKTADFLAKTLKEADIFLDCWFTNLVLCSTQDNKINKDQVKVCINTLKTQIEVIKPTKIFTLGKVVTEYVKEHFPNENIVETAHPTYIKRFYSGKPEELENYVNIFKINK